MKLNDPSLFRQACPIADRWIEAEGRASAMVRNPATGEVLGAVPDFGATETEEAIAAAVLAQKLWAKKTAGERATVLKTWHRLMIENRDDLAMILTLEQGKPLAEAKGEITYGASFIEWFAEEARRINGEIVPGHQPDKRILVLRQPAGVVAAITPWNFPNAMITRKIGPALAAGCAVVLKPALQTPFSAIAIAVLAERAGLPSGLLNIVTGDAAAIGGALTASRDVRVLTFTGSTRTGELLYRQCAPTIKKLGLELGGNAPFIVFDDADLDAAVEGAIIAKFRNNGQTCVCANRLYVQDGVYEAFAAKLAEAVSKLKVGNGLERDVVLGPLIDDNAVAKVESHIQDAVAKGAGIVTGGKRHALGGHFFEPTILRDVSAGMQVAREETFGPLAPLFRFRDEQDVIEQANDTEFGLASYFYARDLSRVFRVAEALEYGMVGVNTGLVSTAEAPFGGVKMSGLGREGSRHGLDEYTELKYVCLGGIA
ncbi:succinate-semialdehyde dehydrogenase (NADP(+)) protein (plasmid) [Rhizobium phaseoli]|uniref:NAD-dependent succinate-semialdehyde dehydrogenase n=1 Tax=Rhizobium phaseoli TaxID=396 RepID=A0A192TJD9_9HYPH|nr:MULTISPECIES: NAD-dependent succinate-semialdehyde dehydrogenase [Rhizobium]ANL42770.1 succinate-semialdehyde dehydrogenase (NADP(+)) protein [Rhizobium phaseoli]ANL55447.1 succinate-semialdehyde dehydrogenase (NADP(+)) protein [Rhizobium phaseoli]ANL61756.1 succinate-semialdehyde dehydrogenase (NADP(+)) protein [Rhizobium phaseoli]ANL74364.1 succinate-semialdehyde dehydrogenase (NADP(+)) protein [Rhizobium phaseoli]ANL87173.1 succinate-semialdehyde dehydrogenase (NADP(+)) protein [Rhizobiu